MRIIEEPGSDHEHRGELRLAAGNKALFSIHGATLVSDGRTVLLHDEQIAYREFDTPSGFGDDLAAILTRFYTAELYLLTRFETVYIDLDRGVRGSMPVSNVAFAAGPSLVYDVTVRGWGGGATIVKMQLWYDAVALTPTKRQVTVDGTGIALVELFEEVRLDADTADEPFRHPGFAGFRPK